MAHETYFDPKTRWFRTRLHGLVTADEMVSIYLDWVNSGHWQDHVGRLTELDRGGDISAWTLEVYRETFIPVIEAHADKAGPSRRAAWVAQSDLSGPILKLWEVLAENGPPDTFRVFHTVPEAEAWLSEGAY